MESHVGNQSEDQNGRRTKLVTTYRESEVTVIVACRLQHIWKEMMNRERLLMRYVKHLRTRESTWPIFLDAVTLTDVTYGPRLVMPNSNRKTKPHAIIFPSILNRKQRIDI